VSGQSGRRAAFDLLLVLGVLFVVKAALLSVDILWTYAGPISLLVSLAVATLCLRRDGEGWADVGLRRPASLARTLGWALLALVTTIAAGIAIEAGVTAAGLSGGEVDPRYARRFADMPGNTPMYVSWLLLAWIVGGFTEEMLFRGFLIARFERLLPLGRAALPAAVGLQAMVFGQQHFYYQGWSGALATGGIALVSGGLVLLFRRNLWPLILSHGASNTLGMTLIYLGVQPAG